MTNIDAIANLTYRRDCWIGLKYVNNEPEPWISGVLEEAMRKGAEALEEQEVWFDDNRSDWERGYNNCVREIMGI